jgi:hypothetical protein
MLCDFHPSGPGPGNMLDHLVMLHERQILLDASVAEIAARVVFEETTEKPQDEILYMEKNFMATGCSGGT